MKDVSLRDGICWQTCVETQLSGKRDPDWLQSGDILFAARGNNNYAVAVTTGASNLRIQAVASPHFYIIRTKGSDVLSEYLTWLLNQRPSQRYFEQNAEGSVAKSIRRTVLENCPVIIPSLSKQRAIVGLSQKLLQEQRFLEQLVKNGDQLMTTIATNLLGDLKG